MEPPAAGFVRLQIRLRVQSDMVQVTRVTGSDSNLTQKKTGHALQCNASRGALQSTSRQFGEICRAKEWPISASRSISWV